jgi:hypothetical protein
VRRKGRTALRAQDESDDWEALTAKNLAQLESAASAELVEAPDPEARTTEALREASSVSHERLARAAWAAASLALSDRNVAECIRVAKAIQNQGAADVAEQLLETLVVGELPIAAELAHIEGALVALLQRTVTEPAMHHKVAKSLKETVAVNTAVLRRMQNALSAVAALRAERPLLNGIANGGANGK